MYQSGTRAVVELSFGLVVTYDWDCQLRVSLPQRFQDQVCGLCGNYNGDPADDFLTPDWEQAADLEEFASSWRLDDGDYLCDDGCQSNCPTCTPGQAQHYEGSPLCGMLTLSDGPFAACHESLNPQPFLEDCVYDLCVTGGERLSLCRSLSAYAQACVELGISVGNWRSPANCREYCPGWGLGAHCGEQGTPCLWSIPEHLLWVSLVLGNARDTVVAKTARLCHVEPEVGADTSLDSNSLEWLGLGWAAHRGRVSGGTGRHRQRGWGGMKEIQGTMGQHRGFLMQPKGRFQGGFLEKGIFNPMRWPTL